MSPRYCQGDFTRMKNSLIDTHPKSSTSAATAERMLEPLLQVRSLEILLQDLVLRLLMLLLVSFCENSFVHRGYGEERHRPDLDLGRVDGVEVRQEGQEREADGQQDGCHQD